MDVQGDTGANILATNKLEPLWNYKEYEQLLKITTYNKESTMEPISQCFAIRKGTMKLITDDNTVMKCRTLYCPKATRTILSLYCIMIDSLYTKATSMDKVPSTLKTNMNANW